MTANELYRIYLKDLQRIHPALEAATITAIIFESFAGISRSDLIKDPEKLLDPELAIQLENSLAELKLKKPVQYVTGEAWFCKMKLKVTPAVLIPRPETEELAEAAISFLHGFSSPKVLDIGTGSGCIPIAIKKTIPGAIVTAVDISPEALQVATENAIAEKTNMMFRQMNFLDESSWPELDVYDVIISNPPYIPVSEMAEMDNNVTDYEPHTALFVADEQPLVFYEKIAGFGKDHLKENGRIIVEIHEQFSREVAALFNVNGYRVMTKNDFYGKQRMVIATRFR
jgi:release factor glutamine methyltransferase